AGLVGGTLYNPATGTTTRIDILDNGRTLRLTYQGPTAAFEAAGPNAIAARAALQEIWAGQIAPGLGFDEQRAAFAAAVGDLEGFAAEALAGQE
ncbi:MAG: hypothetical protein LBU23_03060, partial [Planctomycetota bacterium]|nr:hypothetical protein [Planctomycetota bacterium]